jgi:hypothetical protein
MSPQKKQVDKPCKNIVKRLNSLDLKGWLIGIPVFFSDVYFCLFPVFRHGSDFSQKVEITKRPFK